MAAPLASEEDIRHLLEHLELKPGEECPGCKRKIPAKKKDDQPGPARDILSISTPKGYPPLDDLLIQVVDKYQEQWPREYASMRENVGLALVGERSWRYFVLHFCLYAVLNVPGLEPNTGDE